MTREEIDAMSAEEIAVAIADNIESGDAETVEQLRPTEANTMTLDLSRLDAPAAKRERAAELLEQFEAIDAEQDEALAPIDEAFEAKLAEVRANYSEAVRALQQDRANTHAAIQAPFDERRAPPNAEFEKLDLEPMRGDGDEALFCALSGLLICDGDDVLADESTGELVLRDLLPWPADDPATDDDADEPA